MCGCVIWPYWGISVRSVHHFCLRSCGAHVALCSVCAAHNEKKHWVKDHCIRHLGEQKCACIHTNSSISISSLLLHTSPSLPCIPPSLPRSLSPPPSSLSLSLSLSLSVVVLPCDRGEGSPGGALLGGHGVLLRQALLHLLLPDQDTQVDVLRRRPRQRGEIQFAVCMLQRGEVGVLLYSICCISSCACESSNDKNYAARLVQVLHGQRGRLKIDYVFKV